MLIGYARVSKADGSQSLDLQHDALRAADVERDNIYEDRASGSRDDRPRLTGCLKSLRADDVLVVWKLDRLGRSLTHLVNTVKDLSERKIDLRVVDRERGRDQHHGRIRPNGVRYLRYAGRVRAGSDPGAHSGWSCCSQSTGRKGGRNFALTKAQVRLPQAAMASPSTGVSALKANSGTMADGFGVYRNRSNRMPTIHKSTEMSSLFISLFLFTLVMAANAQPWQSSEPASAGWSVAKLKATQDYAASLKPTAVMVVQDGKVIASWAMCPVR